MHCARLPPIFALVFRAASLRYRLSCESYQDYGQIYTNDGSKLSNSLSRESSQRTAAEVEQQPAAPKTEPVSLRGVRPSEEELSDQTQRQPLVSGNVSSRPQNMTGHRVRWCDLPL